MHEIQHFVSFLQFSIYSLKDSLKYNTFFAFDTNVKRYGSFLNKP